MKGVWGKKSIVMALYQNFQSNRAPRRNFEKIECKVFSVTQINLFTLYSTHFTDLWSLRDRFGSNDLKRLQPAKSARISLCFRGLLWQQDGVDVWQHTSLSDGHSRQELVQLFVIADCELQVTGVDTGLFVVTGCVSSQLQHFSCQVFQNSGNVDWGSGTNTFSVVSFAKETMKTTDWELKSSTGRTRLGLSSGLGLSTYNSKQGNGNQ
jgi:hypothetical protein